VSGTRWRQNDFDAAEFRRSFAGAAVRDNLKGFRSIQVAPVANRGLERCWISGTFTVGDDLQIAQPSGVVSLTLHAARHDPKTPAFSAPRYWNLLCRMLGGDERGDEAKVDLPTGSWYRLLLSMDLTIDDGLDWTTSSF
jgi:hypothetical protein